MSEHDTKADANTLGQLETSARKAWSTPQVIMATVKGAEAKGTPAAATPDSHFNSNDYGRDS